jgi:hypothetical protein
MTLRQQIFRNLKILSIFNPIKIIIVCLKDSIPKMIGQIKSLVKIMD